MIISILLFLSIPLYAEFTPLPADTPESTNSNFKTIDEEIRRLDSVISSTYGALGVLTGTSTWSGGNTFTGPVSGIYNIAWASATATQAFSGTNIVGVIGSTVSLTLTGNNRVRVHGTISVKSGSSGGNNQDLRILHGENRIVNSAVGDCRIITDGVGAYRTCYFNALTVPLSANTTTFSLMLNSTGSADVIPSDIPWIIYAEEIR